MPCTECKQKGWIKNKEKECKKCSGKGVSQSHTSKKITISKNFDYLTKMKLTGQGNYVPEAEESNDVFIVFELKLDSMEVFDEYNLIFEKKINIGDALSGYLMYWTHPDGNKYLFKFDDVIKDSDVKYVKNLGLPFSDNNGSGRGKLFIRFKYNYPTAVLPVEKLSKWITTSEPDNVKKSEHKKEKVYSIEHEEFVNLVSHKKQKTKSNDSDDEKNGQAPECQVQ